MCSRIAPHEDGRMCEDTRRFSLCCFVHSAPYSFFFVQTDVCVFTLLSNLSHRGSLHFPFLPFFLSDITVAVIVCSPNRKGGRARERQAGVRLDWRYESSCHVECGCSAGPCLSPRSHPEHSLGFREVSGELRVLGPSVRNGFKRCMNPLRLFRCAMLRRAGCRRCFSSRATQRMSVLAQRFPTLFVNRSCVVSAGLSRVCR